MNLNSRKDIFSFFIQYISKILDFVSNHIAANDISEKILLDFESWTRDILKENQSNIYYGVQQATANTIKNLISNLSDSYTDIEVKDFKYILSGLFDEIIIYLSNIDKEEWNKYMIERYLFNTATSGSQIIEMIKVHNQSHTMKDNEMSIIYYQILSFGYMGKYRFEKVKYRKLFNNSFKVLSRDCHLKTIDDTDKISENCYTFTFSSNKKIKFTNYYKIYSLIMKFFVICQLLIIFIIYIFWIRNSVFKI